MEFTGDQMAGGNVSFINNKSRPLKNCKLASRHFVSFLSGVNIGCSVACCGFGVGHWCNVKPAYNEILHPGVLFHIMFFSPRNDPCAASLEMLSFCFYR